MLQRYSLHSVFFLSTKHHAQLSIHTVLYMVLVMSSIRYPSSRMVEKSFAQTKNIEQRTDVVNKVASSPIVLLFSK
jgi:hypothetical protein